MIQASNYVEWAIPLLHLDVHEVNKLASMEMQNYLNLFEIDKMFAEAMNGLGWKPPTKGECLEYHLKQLHAQLLKPHNKAISTANKLYAFTIEHELVEEQMNWQEISDLIDDFSHGDNPSGLTQRIVEERILRHARDLWNKACLTS